MAQAEGDGGVALVVVSVVDLDLDAAVAGEVGAVEAVGREGALPAMQKLVGMLDEPGRVNCHVVGHMSLADRRPKCAARCFRWS